MSFISEFDTPVVIASAVGVFLLLLLLVVIFIKKNRTGGDELSSVNKQVYVGNLSYRVKEHHLREFFSCFGQIETLKIIKNHNSGRSKGYGFITFKKESYANSSLDNNGKDFEGRALVVRIARPK
jgi:RNA recognition motif-containing protein